MILTSTVKYQQSTLVVSLFRFPTWYEANIDELAQMPGSVKWQVAREKAMALVNQMTLEERANITVGFAPGNGCSGTTGTVPRLGWEGLCLVCIPTCLGTVFTSC